MFFRKNRKPPVDQQLPIAPVFTEHEYKWFEVVLCEQGPGGEVVVKDHRKSLEPAYSFHEELHPDKLYAMAIRRVEARDGKTFIGDWTELTEWRKPNRSALDG